MTIVDWASYAAQLGMDYIDMNQRSLLDMTVKQAEQTREKLTMPVMMVTIYLDFTNPDSVDLKRASEDTKNDIKLCDTGFISFVEHSNYGKAVVAF